MFLGAQKCGCIPLPLASYLLTCLWDSVRISDLPLSHYSTRCGCGSHSHSTRRAFSKMLWSRLEYISLPLFIATNICESNCLEFKGNFTHYYQYYNSSCIATNAFATEVSGRPGSRCINIMMFIQPPCLNQAPTTNLEGTVRSSARGAQWSGRWRRNSPAHSTWPTSYLSSSRSIDI